MASTIIFDNTSATDLSKLLFLRQQITVTAFGIPVGQSVVVELVRANIPEPLPTYNPPVEYVEPTVLTAIPLTCGDGEPIQLTANRASLIIDTPLHSWIRFRFTGGVPNQLYVSYSLTATQGVSDLQRGCSNCCNSQSVASISH